LLLWIIIAAIWPGLCLSLPLKSRGLESDDEPVLPELAQHAQLSGRGEHGLYPVQRGEAHFRPAQRQDSTSLPVEQLITNVLLQRLDTQAAEIRQLLEDMQSIHSTADQRAADEAHLNNSLQRYSQTVSFVEATLKNFIDVLGRVNQSINSRANRQRTRPELHDPLNEALDSLPAQQNDPTPQGIPQAKRDSKSDAEAQLLSVLDKLRYLELETRILVDRMQSGEPTEDELRQDEARLKGIMREYHRYAALVSSLSGQFS